jgi:hypothetical protein
MNLRTLFLAAPLAVVMACGGSTSTGTGSAALDAAVPTFAKLSIDQTAADATPPAVLVTAPAAIVTEAPAAQMMGPGGVCHPHLFVREREVVERVNRHIYKVLGRIEKLIAANPLTSTESSKVWTKTEGGVTSSFTISLVAPNVYGWEFDAGVAAPTGPTGPTGPVALPVIMTGEIDRNGAVGAHDGKGSMEIDFTKFHAAFPNEKVAQGTLEVQFNVSATARTIAAKATGIVWDLDPGHFADMGGIPVGLTQPRSGEYVYFREPGKGGSLKIQDEMVFGCAMDPKVTNPSLLPANAKMVSRWFRDAAGLVHGRSDGLITGGQLVAPVASIVGVTCHNAPAEQGMPAEGFWLMKAENTTGGTVVGFSSASVNDPAGTPCDAIFGDVPVLADAGKDFTGWPTSFYETPPVPFPFPGM